MRFSVTTNDVVINDSVENRIAVLTTVQWETAKLIVASNHVCDNGITKWHNKVLVIKAIRTLVGSPLYEAKLIAEAAMEEYSK
jgi:hypothetical protein